MKLFLLLISVIGLCCPIVGCSGTLLPSFDGGVLNPDLRFLRTGEIMEGVKCATTAFIDEREKKLARRRGNKQNRQFYIDVEGPRFHQYALNVPEGVPNICDKKGHHWEPVSKNGEDPCKPNNCAYEKTSLGIAVWDYGKKIKSSKADCEVIPDYSNFALDPTQTAEIDLKLTANNLGDLSLGRIDALALDPRQIIITPGGANGAPFPQFSVNDKTTTTFQVSAQMPQTVHGFLYSPLDVAKAGRRDAQLAFFESPTIPAAEKTWKEKIGSPRNQFMKSKKSVEKAPLDFEFQQQIISLLEDVNKMRGEPSSSKLQEDIDDLSEYNDPSKPVKVWPEQISELHKKAFNIGKIIDLLKIIENTKNDIFIINKIIIDDKYNYFTTSARQSYDKIKNELDAIVKNLTPNADDFYARPTDAIDRISGVIRKLSNAISKWAQQRTQEIIARLSSLPIDDLSTNQALRTYKQVINAQAVFGDLIKLVTKVPADDASYQPTERSGEEIARDLIERMEQATNRFAELSVEDHLLPGFYKAGEKKPKSKGLPEKTENKHRERCDVEHSRLKLDGGREIDYLGLKKMLNNFLEEQKNIHVGLPEITLNELTLTSQFVVTLDVSAGMAQPIFQIFPVLAPPSAQFKTDHTHTLKLTFKGKKQKKKGGRQKVLSEACKNRFQPEIPDDEDICNTQLGLLLEQLIQSSGGSGGSQ